MISTLAALVLALSTAIPGDTVWVTGTINATGNTLTVPGGVTLYSNTRALIYSTSFTPVTGGAPLVQTGGPNVTLSGLRLRGATGEITDFDYRRGVSKGVHGNHPGLKVVGCEIMWFDMWGVYLYAPKDAVIEGNYIHNCRNCGYGYGVWVGGSGTKYEGTAIIRKNIFDACRSAVDGSGHYSNMVIDSNVFLPEQHYTVISRHGQSNGCKGGNNFTATGNIVTADQRAFTVPDPATDTGYINITNNRIRNNTKSVVGCAQAIPLSDPYVPLFTVAISGKDTVKLGTPISLSASGADTYWWRFGDGLIDQGQRIAKSVSYTYTTPGVYMVTCIGWKGLEPSIAYKPVVVLPDSGIWLNVSVKDSYIGSLRGAFVKSILINGSPVWSDDVSGYEGWTKVSLRCDTLKTLSLELRSLNGCSQSDIAEMFCWWDGVSVLKPNGVVFYESFEGKVVWTLKTDPLGSGVSTQTPVGERREGEKCYLMRYAYGKDILPGWGCTISYKVIK